VDEGTPERDAAWPSIDSWERADDDAWVITLCDNGVEDDTRSGVDGATDF
jgi:hypothetical protein